MKKFLVLLLAMITVLLAPLSAWAASTVGEPVVLEKSATLTRQGSTYYMSNTVYDMQGNVVAGPFGNLTSRQDGLYYEVINQNGLNTTGVIDCTGVEVLPMAYGDIKFVDDNWILGIVLEATTDVNGDYKDSKGNQYNISRVDVVCNKAIIGSLSREDYQSSTCGVAGKYLYIRTSTKAGIWLDPDFNRVDVSADDFSTNEFTNNYKKGVMHNPTQTLAFTAGCTLQPEDVDQTVWYTDDGDFVDLQGNLVSKGTFAADKEYDAVFYYGGDYLVVRANSLRGLVDLQGNEIVAPQYQDIGGTSYGDCFALGYQAVLTQDGGLQYLDKQGNVLTSVDYKLTNSDYRGFMYNAPMVAVQNMGKYIIITATKGQLEETYDDATVIRSATQRIMAVQQCDLWGVIDMDGNQVIPFIFRYSPDISADGTHVLGSNADREYLLYTITYDEAGVVANTDVEEPAETDDDTGYDRVTKTSGVGDGEWGCTNCQTINSGKFCTECGAAKPVEEEAPVSCSGCGYTPEDGSTPKFCPECGTRFE